MKKNKRWGLGNFGPTTGMSDKEGLKYCKKQDKGIKKNVDKKEKNE